MDGLMTTRGKVYTVLQKILVVVIAVFSFITAVGAVGFLMDIKWGDDSNKFLLLLLEAFFSIQLFLLIVGLFKLADKAERAGRSYIYTAACFVFAAVITVILMFNLNPRPVTDSYDCLNAARVIMNEGIFTADNIHAAEIKQFENNYFLVVIFKDLLTVFDKFGITDIYRAFYIINILFLFTGHFLTWKLVKEARSHKAANKVLCLFVLNPVYYLIIFWIYQVMVSYPLIAGVLYCLYKIKKTESRKPLIIYSLISGLVFVIAYRSRPTNVFPVIAAAVMALFVTDFGKKWKKALIVIITGAVIAVPGWLFMQYRQDRYFSEVSDSAYSLYYWFSLGSHDNGGTSTKEIEKTIISEYGDDYEGRDNAMRDYVIENYRNMGIPGICNLWLRKTVVNWSDGYCNLEIRHTQGNHDTLLYEYLAGNHSQLFVMYSRCYRLVTMLAVGIYALSCLKRKKISLLDTMLFLALGGGFVFYLIWEVKSIYSMVLMPEILILAASGSDLFSFRVYGIRKIIIPPYIAGVLLSALVLISLGRFETGFMYYRVHGAYNNRHRERILNGNVVEQSFRSADRFNVIELPVSVSDGENDSRYSYVLRNTAGEVYAEGEYTAGSVSDGTVVISTGQEVPAGEYELELTKLSDSDSYTAVFRYNSYYYDQYDGQLLIDGKAENGDLRMRVGYFANERYFSNSVTAGIVSVYLLFSAAGACFICINSGSMDRKNPQYS